MFWIALLPHRLKNLHAAKTLESMKWVSSHFTETTLARALEAFASRLATADMHELRTIELETPHRDFGSQLGLDALLRRRDSLRAKLLDGCPRLFTPETG